MAEAALRLPPRGDSSHVAIDVDITSSHRFRDLAAIERDLARLRQEQPVAWIDRDPYRPFWAILRHEDIVAIERQHELFVSGPRLTLVPKNVEEAAGRVSFGGFRETVRVTSAMARMSTQPTRDFVDWLRDRATQRRPARLSRVRTLIDMDEPEHRPFREITQSWFMGAGVKRLEGNVDAMVQRYVARMRDAGGEIDFARDVAVWFPLSVIMSVLGLPEQDAPFILRATQEMLNASDPDLQRSDQHGVEAVTELFEYFVDIVKSRRRNPGPDLTSVVANARIDGRPLGPVETFSYLMLATTAGHETTAASIGGGMQAFIENPAQRERLVAQPELGRSAADEIVRWVSPVRHFCRTATRDTEVRGVRIAAGESVALWFMSGNRDEAAFDRPYEFRIDRKPNNHLAFGHGVHHCLGRLLALTEIRAFYSALLPQLADVELAGPPRPIESNFTGGLKSLPIRYRWR